MSEPVIAAARTPTGRAFKGSLPSARPDGMAAFVVREVLDRLPQLDRREDEHVYVGAAVGASEQGYNLGRAAALLAGLPDTVPGATVNRMRASSPQTIRMAAPAIRAGEGDVFVAAGVERVTRTASASFEKGGANPRCTDETREDVNHYHLSMGLTAENVAGPNGVAREEMDALAKLSQDRAVAAQEAGVFDREIVPYPLPDGTLVSKDGGPRPGTTLEKLAQLEPAFRPGGRVTAGDACPLNDGAAAVVVMPDARARELGIKPLARIVASAASGVAPEIMGVGPIEAVRKVLDRAGMTIEDVDVVELNEAFAAPVLPAFRELGIDVERPLNPHGGAIALGHPFGMTGARIATTGMAVMVERL